MTNDPRRRVFPAGAGAPGGPSGHPGGAERRDAAAVPRPSPDGAGRARRALDIVGAWTLFAVFLAAQRYLRGPSLQPRMALPWWETLAASLVTAGVWAALTPAAMRLARRRRPGPGRFWSTVPALVGAGVAAALLHLVVTNVFWQLADPRQSTRDFVPTFLATLAFGGATRLSTFFGILVVTWGIDDYRDYRQKALRSSELERELVSTELEALKLRLQPSFLFHTLDAIIPLIRQEPRAAARTVVQLGDILRLALHNDAAEPVSLKAELDTARLYLQIEQTRLRGRLEVGFDVEPAVLDAAVPSLILLPLLEGAIANGVAVRPGRSRIDVRAREEKGALRLDVLEEPADSGDLSDCAPLDESFVRRTRRRLELLFPNRDAIVLSDRLEMGHGVSLTLPLARARGTEAAEVGAA